MRIKVITTIKQMQQISAKLHREGKTIGFVPTMGYLHAGHGALLEKCRKENDVAVLSIFVNPLQFGPNEDFRRYPRDKKHDELLAKKKNVDIIFYPSEKEMYPTGYLTKISVGEIGKGLCGRSRPGHFDGVATVVAKLINAVNPDVMYLGQKDAQQVVVLKQLASDLNWPLTIRVVPTVREKDGLALSSRNKYLSSGERIQAASLYRSLQYAKTFIRNGERHSKNISAEMARIIKENDSAKIDYIACVDAESLAPLIRIKGNVLIALAVFIGRTRLIDNIVIKVS